jgi:hypothetical protein
MQKQFLPCTSDYDMYIARCLLISINTTVYYFLSDELHDNMFRPLGGHLQATEVQVHAIVIFMFMYFNGLMMIT